VTYDVDETLDALRAVVAEAGADYVYPDELRVDGTRLGMCMYVKNGVPACIVGRVIARLFPKTDLKRLPNTTILLAHRTIPNHGDDAFTYRALQVLARAQDVQDGNSFDGMTPALPKTWGTALAAAERRAAED